VQTAAVEIPVLPRWLGKPVLAERKESEGLRAMMITAQQTVCNLLFGACTPYRMHIWWEVALTGDEDGPGYEWNPQDGVPANAARLICRGTATEREATPSP
jgi:hypothetical protein